MAKVLDRSKEEEASRVVLEALEEAGYTVEESIPGLVQAILNVAAQLDRSAGVQALDEAVDLLS